MNVAAPINEHCTQCTRTNGTRFKCCESCRAAWRKYQASSLGQARMRKYQNTDKFRAVQRKFRSTPKRKAIIRKHNATDKGKATLRRTWRKRAYGEMMKNRLLPLHQFKSNNSGFALFERVTGFSIPTSWKEADRTWKSTTRRS